MNRLRPTIIAVMAALVMLAAVGGVASAHVHSVDNPNHTQEIAGGQNHPGFGSADGDGVRHSCEGVLEPDNAGPAGYGTETAHHGPDADPGKADGCFAQETTDGTSLPDSNPAID